MKCKTILVVILLISIGIANVSQSSVLIPYHGVYKTPEISFAVNYSWGNSSPRMVNGRAVMDTFSSVNFQIKSNPGYQIYNETHFTWGDRSYYFQARNVNNYFYESAERSFQTGLKK